MPVTVPRLALALASAPVLFLAACGGGGGSSGGFGGGGTGTLSLAITDAPVDEAAAVVVQFTGVALKQDGGEEVVYSFDTPRTLDLLALQGGATASLLQGVTVPAGRYEWMRLAVNTQRTTLDSYLQRTDGTQWPLFVPSGSQSGLKLVSGFTVPTGGSAAFTIDFDLRKSVVAPAAAGSPYLLKPALRVVDDAQAGTITGTVGATYLGDASCPFPANPALNTNLVYVFEGTAVPDDIDSQLVEPLTTARVVNRGADHAYTAAFIAPGTYTLAFTCQGALDDPQDNDTVVFLGTRTVTVTAGATTASNF